MIHPISTFSHNNFSTKKFNTNGNLRKQKANNSEVAFKSSIAKKGALVAGFLTIPAVVTMNNIKKLDFDCTRVKNLDPDNFINKDGDFIHISQNGVPINCGKAPEYLLADMNTKEEIVDKIGDANNWIDKNGDLMHLTQDGILVNAGSVSESAELTDFAADVNNAANILDAKELTDGVLNSTNVSEWAENTSSVFDNVTGILKTALSDSSEESTIVEKIVDTASEIAT